MLDERGEAWPHTDASRWGDGLTLPSPASAPLCDALAVLGGPDLDEIIQIHDETHNAAQ